MEGSCASSKPQFFKILLPGFFKKLTIPRAFRKHIDGDKCRRVTLVSSLGKVWHIRIVEDNMQRLHFGDGWQDFARAHRLGVGFFLVFSYDGDMAFTVTVFDLSCCLINYGGARATATPNVIKIDYGENKNFEEISKDPEKSAGKSSGKSEPEVLKSSNSGSNGSGLQFEVVMKRSYVGKISQANIPLASVKALGLEGERKLLILKDLEGKSWPILVRNKAARRERRSYRPCLGKGWREFVKKKNLVEGDTCVFELVSREQRILNVRVLKH